MKQIKKMIKWLESKNKSVFIRYFIIHIILFSSLILLSNYVIYNQVTSTMKKNLHDAQVDLLHQYQDSMNYNKQEIEQVIQQTLNTQAVHSLLNTEENDPTKINQIKQNIDNTVKANDEIVSVYIFTEDKNQIIASNGEVYETESFYDNEWMTHYNHKLIGTHLMETRPIEDGYGNTFDVMTYIHSYPYKSMDQKGAIVINVNVDRLYKRLIGLNHETEGSFYVLNDDGKVILHENQNKLYENMLTSDQLKRYRTTNEDFFEETSEDREILYTYINSPTNQWNYVYEISIEDLNGFMSKITFFVVIISLIAIILSLLLSYMMSRYVSNPVKKLVKLIPSPSNNNYDQTKYRDEFHYLDEVYHTIIEDNQQLNDRISNIRPVVKEKLIARLLTSKKISQEDVYEKLDLLQINFPKGSFIVITIQIDDYHTFAKKRKELEMNIYKMGLTQYIEEYLSAHYQLMAGEIEIDKISAIIHYKNDLSDFDVKEKLTHLMKKLQSEISDKFPFTVTLGMGRANNDLIDIHDSYMQSLRAIKYKFYLGKDQFISVEEVNMNEEELYFYTSENAKSLLNTLKIADFEQIEPKIDQLFNEITKSGHLPYAHVHQIFIQLISAIIELLIENQLEMKQVFGEHYNIYEEFNQQQTIYDMKDFLHFVSEKVAKHILEASENKESTQSQAILKYIDQHFHKDISLQDVSEWVGLSSTYTSRILKEATGKSYVEYVNTKRIKRAKSLLENTQLTVKEIGFKIGFNNIQTFMRVFKKIEGITPGQYRDKK